MNNDAKEFLRRVIPATGNFYILAVQGKRGMWHRVIKVADGFDPAESLIDWGVREGIDIFHALAAYTMAEERTYKNGNRYLYAKRDRANVHSIKVLAIDCDVARDDDGKDRAKVFATQQDAVVWLLGFCKTTRIPPPNMAVHSGYGLHFYWVMEDPMTTAQWQPLADALKAAMLANGFTGDTAITIDAARILRPPTSVNMKSGQPAPVSILNGFTRNDYKNADILAALTPYINVTAAGTGTHGPATVSALGPRPAHATPANPLNPAAHANVSPRRWKFSQIAGKCAQMALTVKTGGAGNGRDHWYKGDLTLLTFCEDGDQFPHVVSQGDPRYTAANVDKHYQQAQAEVQAKGLGGPLCVSFNAWRSNVCSTCPHFGKIKSPVTLGVDDDELPYGYRRGTGRIERLVGSGDDAEWRALIEGDVREPRLVARDTGGLRLEFTYTSAGRTHYVGINGSEVGNTKPYLVDLFERQGVTVKPDLAKHVADFIVAWITQLRKLNAHLFDPVPTFGWVRDKAGKVSGLSVGGIHYRSDGTSFPVTGGDRSVVKAYEPRGNIANWRKAAAWFEGIGARPDLQLVIALGFAAPLIGIFSDVMGMSWNLWTPEGGAGKTSAMHVGQAIWGALTFIQSEHDTANAVASMMSRTHIMPKYWDEMRIDKERYPDFVSLVYQIAQGREKARLTQQADLKEIRDWRTMLVMTSNRALSDIIMTHTSHTNAGAMRMMEVQIAAGPLATNPQAQQDIALCDANYGHAGVLFAQYIVANVDTVRQLMLGIQAKYLQDLNATPNDRFLVAGMTCAMTGAAIARQLGLFNFDLNGIDTVMRNAFREMTTSRADQLTTVKASGEIDMAQVLIEFCEKHIDRRLYTRELSRNGKKVDMLAVMPFSSHVYYQVAHDDKLMLVSLARFHDYLGEKGISRRGVDYLTRFHGVRKVKQTLGAGTPVPQMQTHLLEVPLATPFDGMLDPHHDQPSLAVQPVATARNAAAAGNQTKETQ